MGQVVELFNAEEGKPFQIQDSLPFDGRVVNVVMQDGGVKLSEIIDEEEQSIFISVAELNALLYIMSERQ